MNMAQISYLLGHGCIRTTMAYLDIPTEQEENSLETFEHERKKNVTKSGKIVNMNSKIFST